MDDMPDEYDRLRDVSIAIALLDDVITQMAVTYRVGHDIGHTRSRELRETLTEARDTLDQFINEVQAAREYQRIKKP